MNLTYSKCYSHFHPVAIFEVYSDKHFQYVEVKGNLPEKINKKLEQIIDSLEIKERKTIISVCNNFFKEFKQKFRYDLDLFYIPSKVLDHFREIEEKGQFPFNRNIVKYYPREFSTWKNEPLESYIIQIDLLTNRSYATPGGKFKKLSKQDFLGKVKEYRICEDFGNYYLNNFDKPSYYCYYYSPTFQQEFLIGYSKNNRIMFTLHLKNIERYA